MSWILALIPTSWELDGHDSSARQCVGEPLAHDGVSADHRTGTTEVVDLQRRFIGLQDVLMRE